MAYISRSELANELTSNELVSSLLTTGIDVPKIVNLVLLRRVNSRILYEQMLGRATRLCPEIDKETFRIFDAVDLYSNLQNLTEMKPVVVDPAITLEQPFKEFVTVEDEEHRDAIRDQIIVAMARRLRRIPEEARRRYEAEVGEIPNETLERFRRGTGDEAADWARARPGIGPLIDWRSDGASPSYIPISPHEDELISVTRGYGDTAKPEDFLDGFTDFVKKNVNTIAALNIVVQRPRDLTRKQLRELRLELDRNGFSEANLRRAWKDSKNEKIAASVIGFIRQAAVGDPLIPYPESVRVAMERILRGESWTNPQRRWLQRIGEQLEKEVIVDRVFAD